MKLNSLETYIALICTIGTTFIALFLFGPAMYYLFFGIMLLLLGFYFVIPKIKKKQSLDIIDISPFIAFFVALLLISTNSDSFWRPENPLKVEDYGIALSFGIVSFALYRVVFFLFRRR